MSATNTPAGAVRTALPLPSSRGRPPGVRTGKTAARCRPSAPSPATAAATEARAISRTSCSRTGVLAARIRSRTSPETVAGTAACAGAGAGAGAGADTDGRDPCSSPRSVAGAGGGADASAAGRAPSASTVAGVRPQGPPPVCTRRAPLWRQTSPLSSPATAESARHTAPAPMRSTAAARTGPGSSRNLSNRGTRCLL